MIGWVEVNGEKIYFKVEEGERLLRPLLKFDTARDLRLIHAIFSSARSCLPLLLQRLVVLGLLSQRASKN